jgi:hypothetical protein
MDPSPQQAPVNFKRALPVLVAAFVAGLGLFACAEDGENEDDGEPSLSEIREFRAYPVYYSGTSVAGNALLEIFGPEPQEAKRDAAWVLIYGDCDAEGGGCFPPVQIHIYSTCARWAGPDAQLIDVRGAKAIKPFGEIRPTLEIFTGRTTVTIGAESQAILDSAVQALREVHQKKPSRLLPPPVPGSLSGELPCQDGPGMTR